MEKTLFGILLAGMLGDARSAAFVRSGEADSHSEQSAFYISSASKESPRERSSFESEAGDVVRVAATVEELASQINEQVRRIRSGDYDFDEKISNFQQFTPLTGSVLERVGTLRAEFEAAKSQSELDELGRSMAQQLHALKHECDLDLIQDNTSWWRTMWATHTESAPSELKDRILKWFNAHDVAQKAIDDAMSAINDLASKVHIYFTKTVEATDP